MLARPKDDLPSRKEEAIEVTVRLRDGSTIRFRCIGRAAPKATGKWRLDLARALDRLPPNVVDLKQIVGLCDSLTDELSHQLQRQVTRVQPDLIDWELR